MTNCPELSATALSWISPLRRNSTLAPGALLPATIASPPGSTRTMSNTGVTPVSDDRSRPSGAAAPTVSCAGEANCVGATDSASHRAPRQTGTNKIEAPATRARDVATSLDLYAFSIVDPLALGLPPLCYSASNTHDKQAH
jgi:hypothetical protein